MECNVWRRVLMLVLVAALLAAAPALSYVIFLKDGNQIIARDKFRVKGDQALFELQSGVTSSIPLAQIDVERTEQENKVALRGVQVLEGMEKIDQANSLPPPPPPDSISDLLRGRGEHAALQVPEARKRRRSSDAERAASGPVRTPAGYVDLVHLPRRAYATEAVSQALAQYFAGQGIEITGIYQGTEDRQPLVEIVTTSETAVFKALEESANALLQVRESLPDQVDALAILMVSNPQDHSRAGQFQLTPELAEQLASGAVAPPAFFLRHVEF